MLVPRPARGLARRDSARRRHPTHRARWGAALTLILAATPLAAQTTEIELPVDVIEFPNGHTKRGRVIFEDRESLLLRMGSRDREFDQDKLERVDALRRKLPKGLDVIDSLPFGSVGLHLDAAQSLEAMGLPREAHLLYWRVLSFAPDEERAHEGVGSKRSSNRWLVPGGKRPMLLEKRKEQATDWANPWEFETSHFQVRSNLPLEACLTVGFDLERIYRGFYEALGADFRLHEIVEPMGVSVHADRSSYPELSGHLGGYFSPPDNRLYLDASSELDRRLLAHEVGHQLLFNQARHTRRGTGSIPGWLDEGIAQYLQAAAEPIGECLHFRPGVEVKAWLQEHATAADPFSLSRVLNFDLGDFRGAEGRLKYAQSWSLVQFCLHGQDGDLRSAFAEFVRGCYKGKSSSSHFSKALGSDIDDFEAMWTEWVHERAGS